MANDWNEENWFDLVDYAGVNMDAYYDEFKKDIISSEGNVCS